VERGARAQWRLGEPIWGGGGREGLPLRRHDPIGGEQWWWRWSEVEAVSSLVVEQRYVDGKLLVVMVGSIHGQGYQ
jgi:hypothetical protein